MTEHSWAVIGAGPAGIAAVGRLLDHGVAGSDIAWIDPDFAVGDLGTKWRAVPGNTHVSLFLDYLNASPSFRFGEAPHFELTDIDPGQTCLLVRKVQARQPHRDTGGEPVYIGADSGADHAPRCRRIRRAE